MSMSSLIAEFLAFQRFAVVGASADQSKFGYKVLKNYLDHGKNVTPINPKTPEIAGVTCVKSLSELDSPSEYAVSIVTPPHVTEQVVAEASRLGIKYLWMQPGSESQSAINAATEAGAKIIYGGPCVLVQMSA